MNSTQKHLYDVFISYHHADEEWVRTELLPHLEPTGMKVCVAFRNFLPGKPRLVNMQEAVRSSHFTLLIVTPNWIADDWTQYQALLSVTQDPGGGSGSTIPVILKLCSVPEFLDILTSVDFTRPERHEEAWRSLLTALGVKPSDPISITKQGATEADRGSLHKRSHPSSGAPDETGKSGSGHTLPSRGHSYPFTFPADHVARRIAQDMCSAQSPDSYHDFVRQHLLSGDINPQGHDPFASESPPMASNTHVVSRDNLERQFQKAISDGNDILVIGRIGSGKSTLINRGLSLVGEHSLAVPWMITSDEVGPDEVCFHLTPQMLARHIFRAYWDALYASSPLQRVHLQINPNWHLLDTFKWFHARYMPDDRRIPPGLKQEEWKGTPKPLIEWQPDILTFLLEVISPSICKSAGVAGKNTAERRRIELRTTMGSHLGVEDRRVLCFDCEFDLPGPSPTDIDIIQYCQRRGREAELKLLQWLQENRSDQVWPDPWGVMTEPIVAAGISFAQIWIFVDGSDRLASPTQVRFVKQARAMARVYAPHLHWVIAVSGYARAQLIDESPSNGLKILDLSSASQWDRSRLEEMINRRLTIFGTRVPELKERMSDFPLTRQAQFEFLSLIADGARRAYRQNDAVDTPVHALRLMRGFLMACAGCWEEHGFHLPLHKEHLVALVDIYWRSKSAEQHEPIGRSGHMHTFYGREEELKLACDSRSPLLTFYGEAGIGKTRLLNEAVARYYERLPRPFVAYIDYENCEEPTPIDPKDHTKNALAQAMGVDIQAIPDSRQTSGLDVLVRQLSSRDPSPVLVFDTTEKLQTSTSFWEWLEAEIIRPLLIGGRVRMIFAGRVPAPWRDYDVRRLNQIHRLDPLSTQDDLERQGAARDLIRNVLRQSGSIVPDADIRLLTELILKFSYGHPGLSEKLASWVVEPGVGRWPAPDINQFRKSIAEGRIKEYIDSFLFKDIDADWRLILRWAGILNWFDAAVLCQYLEALVVAGVIPRCAYLDNWDSFFVPGIDRLRLQDAAVVWARDGYRLYGVTREIVRQCLKVSDPVGFRRASRCAGQVIRTVASEFAPDEEGFVRYTREAEAYFQQAQEEVV